MSTGALTLRGTELKGRQIVIRAQGTVTIEDNITYKNAKSSHFAELPQLIIISESGNIVIGENVERLDAWLIAKRGYVSTCGAVAGHWTDGLTASVCNKRLMVNGPVIADKIYLRRTFGESGSGDHDHPGVPAETFNLRPDVYLYGYSRTQGAGSISTMYTKELPPRL